MTCPDTTERAINRGFRRWRYPRAIVLRLITLGLAIFITACMITVTLLKMEHAGPMARQIAALCLGVGGIALAAALLTVSRRYMPVVIAHDHIGRSRLIGPTKKIRWQDMQDITRHRIWDWAQLGHHLYYVFHGERGSFTVHSGLRDMRGFLQEVNDIAEARNIPIFATDTGRDTVKSRRKSMDGHIHDRDERARIMATMVKRRERLNRL